MRACTVMEQPFMNMILARLKCFCSSSSLADAHTTATTRKDDPRCWWRTRCCSGDLRFPSALGSRRTTIEGQAREGMVTSRPSRRCCCRTESTRSAEARSEVSVTVRWLFRDSNLLSIAPAAYAPEALTEREMIEMSRRKIVVYYLVHVDQPLLQARSTLSASTR
jgi:hypothetical protein